jgi:TPR repeat protein
MEYSAEQGLPAAQYDLGTLYATGTGTTANIFEAARWIGRAASAGLTEAELEYGILLFKGHGLTPDEVRGAYYFKTAAEKGNAVAQNRYARCLAHGAGVEMNVVEAVKWHLVAKAAGIEDPALDEIANKLSRADRTKAEQAAFSWREQSLMN